MISSKMDRPHAVIIFFFLLLFLPISSLHATEYYGLRLSGSDCFLCHTAPEIGTLNQTGVQFQEEGYRYPMTLKGVLFNILGGPIVFILFFSFYRRYRLWHIGKGKIRWGQWRERWKGLLSNGFGHRTLFRSFFPGIGHFLLFWSFLILSLGVTAVILQEYFIFPLWRVRFIDSNTYPFLRLLFDLFGVLGWLGTILLIVRRYILKPRELDEQRTDACSLVILFFIFLTGFLATGIRNQIYQSPWTSWSPVADSISSFLLRWKMDENHLKIFFSLFWWSHLILSLAFISCIPFSKLLHLFSSPLSILLRNLEVKGTLKKIDLEASETFGVTHLEEFTWKDLLELDGCTRCGRCQENCPAHLTGKPLNPKGVIQNLKRHLADLSRAKGNSKLIGDVVTEEEIWECTTCRNCLEHCPIFIEPMAKLLEFRRSLVLNQGKVPKETHFAFRNIERKGNPWGFEPSKRMFWTKELGLKTVIPGEKTDLLFWIGCYGSYDDRNIKVAESLARILNQAGLNFGVLGSSEWCCGIDLRRMGSEYLFQVNVEKNIEQLKRLEFKKMITTCPHCFNTLKNEYAQFGADFEVIHYTDLVEELIQQNKIRLRRRNEKIKITYHDSCYLGRYNEGYEPPRRILRAMEDFSFTEMEKSREKSFCCGGGGCHMWMEERTGKRINETRILQALDKEAEILTTVCPLCLTQLDSAVKVLNADDRIRVRDILELVVERMET
ncbi:MAG: 4Fe-4S dicluster domain-containing protein [Deltaproteobacteria bacterium]|nr:4Fe-4S dicluster domain-containing protein [Deltaproteobacteria bacterium]MBM4323924.1 4Fe-4S dicluster domain-containing protein [Deltaproteobacteria bacterium]